MTNEIDAWLACDEDVDQRLFASEPAMDDLLGFYIGEQFICQTSGHDIAPGECRPVRLRVEVIK